MKGYSIHLSVHSVVTKFFEEISHRYSLLWADKIATSELTFNQETSKIQSSTVKLLLI